MKNGTSWTTKMNTSAHVFVQKINSNNLSALDCFNILLRLYLAVRVKLNCIELRLKKTEHLRLIYMSLK